MTASEAAGATPEPKPQPKQLPPNHILFREGDEAPDFYVLLAGKLAIFRNRQFVRAIGGAGVFVGEMGTLLGHRRSATVITLEPSTLIAIPKNVDSVFLFRPDIGEKLIESLRKRLSETYDKSEKLWTRILEEISEMIVLQAATKRAARKNLSFGEVQGEKNEVRKMVGLEFHSDHFDFSRLDEFLSRMDVKDEFRRGFQAKYPRFKYVDLSVMKDLWKKRVPDSNTDKRHHCVDLAAGLNDLTDFMTSFGSDDDEKGSEEIDLLESTIPLDKRIAMIRSVAQRVLAAKAGIEGMKRINRDIDVECEEGERRQSRTGRTHFFLDFARRMEFGQAYVDELRREFWNVCVKG